MPMWSRDSAPSHHLDSDGRSTRTRRATSSAQASLRACPAEASSIRDASTSHFPQVFLRLCAVVTLASPTVRFKRQRLGKGRDRACASQPSTRSRCRPGSSCQVDPTALSASRSGPGPSADTMVRAPPPVEAWGWGMGAGEMTRPGLSSPA